LIEGGALPLGRIPSDDISLWQSYFESLNSFSSAPTTCVAISNYPDEDYPNEADWVGESRATLREGKQSGCVSQRLYTLGAMDEDRLQIDIVNEYPTSFPDSSRIIVNLHGGMPDGSDSEQEFVTSWDDGYPPRASLSLTAFNSFNKSILYLFSCYGGNSGWWNSGGAIPHFLKHGGLSVVASSTCSFVSPLDDKGNVIKGSALMCAEFFKALDAGLSLGEAIKLAKMKTFIAAMKGGPAEFCIAIKEIYQYSLYGAPWATTKPRRDIHTAESNSILDKIRNNATSDTLSNIRAGSDILNKVRQDLRESLGEEGIKYFTHTNDYVMRKLSMDNKLETLSTELEALGLNIGHAHFESVSWSGRKYNLGTLKNERNSSQAAMLLILDDDGNLIAKMEARG
jgi:hypothetical protein